MAEQSTVRIFTERSGPNCRRLIRGDQIVGLLLLMSNGTWTICDNDGRRLDQRTFMSHRDAARAAEEVFP